MVGTLYYTCSTVHAQHQVYDCSREGVDVCPCWRCSDALYYILMYVSSEHVEPFHVQFLGFNPRVLTVPLLHSTYASCWKHDISHFATCNSVHARKEASDGKTTAHDGAVHLVSNTHSQPHHDTGTDEVDTHLQYCERQQRSSAALARQKHIHT